MNITKTQKLTIAGVSCALAVVCSAFYIPVGGAKCFPIQHAVNVLAGVLLGPLYGVCMAFITSLIRVFLGTGSLLAFPGSMCGALFCGLCYKYGKKLMFAFLGEVVGTGVIGALLSWPIATLFMSQNAAIFGFVVPFMVSSTGGAAISVVLILVLKKTKTLQLL